jgi:hypothetical protein
MTVFCVNLVIDQPQTGASGVVRQGRRHGPSITYKITSCLGTLLQPARRAAVLDWPSSLRPSLVVIHAHGWCHSIGPENRVTDANFRNIFAKECCLFAPENFKNRVTNLHSRFPKVHFPCASDSRNIAISKFQAQNFATSLSKVHRLFLKELLVSHRPLLLS